MELSQSYRDISCSASPPFESVSLRVRTRVTANMKWVHFRDVLSSMPCPCGYYADLKRECRCGPVVTLNYRQRISGPLLDRIDLHVDVPTVEYKTIVSRELTS